MRTAAVGLGGPAARARTWALVSLLLLVLLAPSVGGKGDPIPAARDAALDYLATQGEPGAYPAGLAPYAVEAAVAAGRDPAAWPSPSRSALAAVQVPAEGNASGPVLRLVRPAYAIALAGGDLSDWKGEDLEARLRDGFDGEQFGDPALLNDDAYAILALRAGGAPADDADLVASASFLRQHRNGDGGWGFAVGGESGTDTTGMVSTALDSLGQGIEERAGSQAFVSTTHAARGFAEQPGGQANCDSTVWALRVLGPQADPDDWWFLLSLQQPGGGFAYQPGPGSNPLCTAEAATLLGDAAAGKVEAPSLGGDGSRFGAGPGLALLVAGLLLSAARFRRN